MSSVSTLRAGPSPCVTQDPDSAGPLLLPGPARSSSSPAQTRAGDGRRQRSCSLSESWTGEASGLCSCGGAGGQSCQRNEIRNVGEKGSLELTGLGPLEADGAGGCITGQMTRLVPPWESGPRAWWPKEPSRTVETHIVGGSGKWEGWGPWQIRGQRKAIHTDTGRALRTRAGAPKQEGDRCRRARVHMWETGVAECAPRGALRRWRSPGEWGGSPRGTLEPPAVCPPTHSLLTLPRRLQRGARAPTSEWTL